jgi:hypothetical protein
VLTFIETTRFTDLIHDLVSDDDYAAFQQELTGDPESGDLMVGCGGVRKIRMSLAGSGKRSGARVCYLYLRHKGVIYLLYVFTKGDADNLSAEGRRAIRTLAQHIRNEVP